MEEVIDYIENLYSDYYQNQDNKSLEEIRALALAKLKAAYNSEYKQCEHPYEGVIISGSSEKIYCGKCEQYI